MSITEPGTKRTTPRYHTIGIGAGPSNLSLAALYKNVTTERLALFDARPGSDLADRRGRVALLGEERPSRVEDVLTRGARSGATTRAMCLFRRFLHQALNFT